MASDEIENLLSTTELLEDKAYQSDGDDDDDNGMLTEKEMASLMENSMPLMDDKVMGKLDEYTLPPSIYSVVVVTMIALAGDWLAELERIKNGDDKELGFGGFCCIITLLNFPPYILLVLNYALQAGFIYYIVWVARSKNACEFIADGGSEWLLFLALSVFACSIINELIECNDMLMWIVHLGKGKHDYLCAQIRSQLASNFKDEGREEKMYEDTMYGSAMDGDPDHKNLIGFVRPWRKLSAIIFVIIPKAAIACFLLYHGAKFLAVSENNKDVILNTVALQFVIEIDEFLYKAYTTNRVKRYVENLPAVKQIKLHNECIEAFANYLCVPMAKIVITILLAFGCYYLVRCQTDPTLTAATTASKGSTMQCRPADVAKSLFHCEPVS